MAKNNRDNSKGIVMKIIIGIIKGIV